MPPLDNIRDAAGDTDGTASATTVDVLPFIPFSFILSAANNAGRARVASEKSQPFRQSFTLHCQALAVGIPAIGTENSCLPTPPFPWRLEG